MPEIPHLRLGVNVDHVATIRNARGGPHPDPVKAALTAVAAGADGITAHLREDRRHIRDDDMTRLKAQLVKPLNFEMAATREMVEIALKVKPHAVCLVPERRQERTTEGGLNAAGVERPVPHVGGVRHAVGVEDERVAGRQADFGRAEGRSLHHPQRHPRDGPRDRLLDRGGRAADQ